MAPTPQLVHPVTTVLDQLHVTPSPAPAPGQPRALPLTFFDLVFWAIPPVQRLFFYHNADLLDAADFTRRELPRFRRSLAAALHHFYPLAGKLACALPDDDDEGAAPPPPPELVFSDGDSVPLTVAVSGDDFLDLAGDHARDTSRLRPLLPALPKHAGGSRPPSRQVQGVLAVQVTVFPRAGICVGTTLHHAVADGSSYAHFLRTWAAAHRNDADGAVVALDVVPPLFDRGVVRDDAGLRDAFLRDHRALGTATAGGGGGDGRLDGWDLSLRPGVGVVLATFRFTEKQLGALGRRVESETSARCSPYALACGAAWAGIVHARGGGGGMDGGHEPEPDAHFGFVTGCRPRASPPVPASYFGNCLGLRRVQAKRGGLTAAAAAAAIWRAIEGLGTEAGSVFRGSRGWVRWVREFASARAVTVAGSPKLGVYAAADLGGAWGRPSKVEIVSVERTGALALAESGRHGDGGGIEVGLALPRDEMETFRVFYLDLASLGSSGERL